MTESQLPNVTELEKKVQPEFIAAASSLNCHHSLVHNAFEWG